MKIALLAASTLTVVFCTAPSASASYLRATCTEGDMVVDTEDLPPNAGPEEKAVIKARFPKAMCVFFEMGSEPANPVLSESSEGIPASANAYQGINAPGGMDKDLATALAIISSGQANDSKYFADKAPVDLTEMMKVFRSSNPETPQNDVPVTNEIALTIGIYKDMEPSDILAHWKQMRKDSTALKKFMPTLTRAGEITMLSIEHVPDSDANAVCEDAAKMGSGCLAYY